MVKKKKKTQTKQTKTSKKRGQSWQEKLKLHVIANANFYLSGLVTVVLMIGVWVYFKDQVTRFSFMMPIFATWIFYLIMTEIEDEEAEIDKEQR